MWCSIFYPMNVYSIYDLLEDRSVDIGTALLLIIRWNTQTYPAEKKNWPTIGIDVSGAFPLLSQLIQSIVSSGKCLDTESSVGRRSGRLHAYVSQGTAMLACVVVSFSVLLLCYTEWTQYKTGKCIGWKIRVSWRGSGGVYPYVSRGTMQQ